MVGNFRKTEKRVFILRAQNVIKVAKYRILIFHILNKNVQRLNTFL